MHRISMIAAIENQTRAIGKGEKLLWRIPLDMAYFKKTTMGHPVIMGSKTWESLTEKHRPLHGRKNIVVSRNRIYNAPGAITTTSIEGAIEIAKNMPGAEEIFIIGGGQIYALSLHLAQRLYLTLVDDPDVDANIFFPEYDDTFTKILSEESPEHTGLKYTFQTLERA